MKALTFNELQLVSGGEGVSNSEANKVIGGVIGEVWHGLTSWEGIIGMTMAPGGAIVGIWVHYKLHH